MRNIINPSAIIRQYEEKKQEHQVKFSIVNYSQVKENDFRLDAEYYVD